MATQSTKSSRQPLAYDAAAPGNVARSRLRGRAPAIGVRWLWLLAALLIAAGALAVRVWTLRRGLPYVDHPDEPNPVDYAIRMLKTGDLNPHAFQKPSLYVYMLLAVLSVQYRRGLESGLYENLNQMFVTTHVYTTLPQFFVWGRTLTAVIGGATVLGVFFVNRRLWSSGAGLVAALFLAASPFHLRHSQYVTTDVTSSLFVLFSFVCAALAAERGRWRDGLLAGLFAGFAASTKYNVGVAALPIVVAHLLYWRRDAFRQLPRLIGAGVAALAGFVVGTPYTLLDFTAFRKGILGQAGDYGSGGHGDFTGAWNWRGYFDFFRGSEFGVVALVATAIGLGLLLWRRRDVGLLWLSFVVPYLLLHIAQGSHFMRNMIPLVVLAALPIGVACAAGSTWAGTRTAWLKPVVAAALLLALLWLPARESWAYSQRMARGDTRVQALAWIDAHVPPGARIAAELRPIPGPVESRWTEVGSLLPHDLAWYRQQGYGYILASSDTWQQWDEPADYQRYAVRPPVVAFGGATARDMLGPHLVLYATGLAPADVPQPLANRVVIGGARLLGVGIGAPDAKAQRIGIAPAQSFEPGALLGIRTFWQVETRFDHDYLLFVHVQDASGATVAQRDALAWQGRFPTTTWQPGSIVVDVNDLPLPAALPPGTYTVVVGMYNPELGANPPMIVDGAPRAAGDVQVGTITVVGK